MLNVLVGKYGIGRIDYVENRFVGIKLREIYEVFVVEVILKVYKVLEMIMLMKDVVYFKLIIEK